MSALKRILPEKEQDSDSEEVDPKRVLHPYKWKSDLEIPYY